jgi:PAS domain S-box-containing protein
MKNKTPLILVIDNDPLLQHSTLLVLNQAGYQTCQASDGLSGLQMARELKPDLTLLAVNLPDMSGYEVCQRIKSEPALKGCFVAVLSERGDSQSQVAGIEGAADVHITLPINNAELLTHVHGLIRLHQAEAALRTSAAFNQAIINSVNAEIVVIDQNGVIVATNDAWKQFSLENSQQSGIPTPNTGIGCDYLAVCPTQDDDENINIRGYIQAVLDGSLPGFTMEYPCHSPQEKRWFRMSISPLEPLDVAQPTGPRSGVVILHTNITDRKLAHEALQQAHDLLETRVEERTKELHRSEERLQLVLKGSQDAHWDWDLVANTIYYSPRWWEMIGYSVDEFLMVPGLWKQLTHPDDLPLVERALSDAIESKQDYYEIEFRLHHKAGYYVPVISRGFIKRDMLGRPLRISGANTDLTERKQTEAALQARLQLSQFADTASLDDILQKTLDQAEILTGSQIGFAHFLDADQQTINSQMWSTNTLKIMRTAEGKDRHFSIDMAGTWAECGPLRTPVFHNHYPSLAHRKELPAGSAPVLRELIVPVLRNNLTVMILGVGNKTSDYTEKDLSVLSQLTDLSWDIVQRKKAEAALRESNDLFSEFMLHSPIYTFIKEITHSESRVLQVSDNYQQMLGITAQEMIGKSMAELFPPEAAAKMLADDLTVMEKRQVLKVDESLNDHHYTTLKFPIIQAGRAMLAGYSIDITERVQVEEKLKKSEANLRTIFENSPQSLILIDRNYTIQAFNPVANQRTQIVFGKEIQLGDSIFNFVISRDREEFDRHIELAFQGQATLVEKSFKNAAAATSTFEFQYAPVHNNDRQVTGTLISVVDITERKQAEEVLRNAHDELELRVAERTAELRAANLGLEKSARLKNEFLATMSHELRTPLTGILGLSEIMLLPDSDPLSEKQRSYLGHINDNGKHLLDMINDILDLSRLESGKLELALESCALDKICHASLQHITEQASAKQLQVSFSTRPSTIQLQADPHRIKQILDILLSNAIKFTPEGGSFGIEILGDQVEKQIFINVWDTGIGIKEEDLARLFQPFVQLDARLARRYNGTGIGLSLAIKLAELHDGSISVQSVAGQGSKFTVSLPWY